MAALRLTQPVVLLAGTTGADAVSAAGAVGMAEGARGQPFHPHQKQQQRRQRLRATALLLRQTGALFRLQQLWRRPAPLKWDWRCLRGALWSVKSSFVILPGADKRCYDLSGLCSTPACQ